jgi:hypothetical protein
MPESKATPRTSDDASPRPWRIVTETGSMGSIESVDGWPVAQCQQPGPDDKLHIRRKANAELIVTAVNERDSLREALEAALNEGEVSTVLWLKSRGDLLEGRDSVETAYGKDLMPSAFVRGRKILRAALGKDG